MSNPETLYFRPRARLMQLLGEQLIRDHRVAVFELVKNAYDADASEVMLTFIDLERAEPRIEIKDDGEGMTPDTVRNAWLEIASDHKEKQRQERKKTEVFLRTPIGEKGVGRFAVHKLGNRIEMVTRAKGSPEVVVDIDWDDFLKYNYLNEAAVKVSTRTPVIFKGDSQGTLLNISGLRQKWTRGDIRRLYRAVMSIVSPFDGKASFKVSFRLKNCPKDWLNDLFRPQDAEDLAMYSFEFEYDQLGFSGTYNFNPLPALQADFKGLISQREKKWEKAEDGNFSLEFYKLKPPPIGEAWKNRAMRNFNDKSLKYKTPAEMLATLGIGTIKGRILAYDLDKELIVRYIPSGLKEYLKEQGGMRVYRDGMRVYDYGEQGNDWLGLDERRFQIPTRRLSNNLILGEIHLNLDESPELVEKTNREGFVENEAYTELRYAVLCALVQFEAERSKDKRIVRRLFGRKGQQFSPEANNPEAAINSLRQKVREQGLGKQLGGEIDQLEKTYLKTRDILMSAVGAGLGLSIIFHEIERGVRTLHQAIEEKFDFARLKAMSKQMVELLQSSTYLIRNQGKESLKASQLVKLARFSLEPRFNYHGIKFVNGFENRSDADFSVRGSRRMLTATLVNLIDNAIYWVRMKRESQDHATSVIWVGPSLDLEAPAIVVADSGTGFEDPPEDVIQPFFSRRLEGMGLGLYFADLTMKGHSGRLAFPSKKDVEIPRACTGARVAMVFGDGGRK